MPRKKIIRYQFSNDLKQRVRLCYQTDNIHGPIETLEHWLVITLSIIASLYAFEYLQTSAAIIIYIITIFFIGGRQRSLADILHQGAHGTLAKNKYLSILLATVFSGYPLFQSFTGYRISHVYNHHGRFGDKRFDPDYIELINAGLYGQNKNLTTLNRYIRDLIMPVRMINYIKYLIKYRLWHKQEDRLEKSLRILFYSLIITISFIFNIAFEVFLYWFVPLFTTQVVIGSLIELLEHYPMMELNSKVDICMSRNRDCHWLSNFLLGIKQYEGYHIVHHKFPNVPPWRNIEVHNILMEDEFYRSLNQKKGWRGVFEDLFDKSRYLDN